MLKSNRNQITLVSRNLPALSEQLNNIKNYHVSQYKGIGACFNMHTSCLLGNFCYVNFFPFSFSFYGSCYMTYKKLFPLAYSHLFQRFVLSVDFLNFQNLQSVDISDQYSEISLQSVGIARSLSATKTHFRNFYS